MVIELEKTFLAKSIPDEVLTSSSKKIVDLYLPADVEHCKLRIRQQGDRYEITKKILLNEADASRQEEQNIIINEHEFKALLQANGKKLEKTRYFYTYKDKIAEVDVFEGNLAGLVVIEFEFDSVADKDKFITPEFCLVDVTQENFIAGGVLAGKSYTDIEHHLDRLGYKKVPLPLH